MAFMIVVLILVGHSAAALRMMRRRRRKDQWERRHILCLILYSPRCLFDCSIDVIVKMYTPHHHRQHHHQVSGDSLSRSSPPPLPSAPQMAPLPVSRFVRIFIIIILLIFIILIIIILTIIIFIIAIIIIVIIITSIIISQGLEHFFFIYSSGAEDIWRWGPLRLNANPTQIMRMIWHPPTVFSN